MSNRPRNWICWLAACVAASLNVGTHDAAASTLPSMAGKVPLGQHHVLPAGNRHYHDYDDDDDFYYPPPDYPAPPARAYGYPPPLPSYYDPPAYGWLPPPRPMSCGKYRYWNGEYCADAPYVGPRW